ncbi:MAG: ABC transporter permease, partial [Flavobacteriales bacterium]
MKKATSLSQLAFQKFCKNFWGMLSVAFLTLAVLVAIFAYGLAPDNSENANQMHLS